MVTIAIREAENMVFGTLNKNWGSTAEKYWSYFDLPINTVLRYSLQVRTVLSFAVQTWATPLAFLYLSLLI